MTSAVFLSACGGTTSSSSNSPGSTSTNYRITLVTGDNHDPFYVTMNHGAQAEAKKLGVTVTWQGPAQFDQTLQIPILDAVLVSKPQFLVVAPDDVQAMINPIKQFNAANIPVLTVDTDVNDPTVRIGNITSNNVLGGQDAAQFLNTALNGQGKVLYVGEQPGVSTTDDRQKGFEAALKQYSGLKYTGPQFDNDDPSDAARVVAAVLQRNPDLAGIFASDTANGAGAATAVQNAGKTGKVKIVAFDAEPDEVQALKKGLIDALIVQKAYDMGVLAVDYAVKYLNGDHAIPALTNPAYVIATKANVDSPAIAPFLYAEH
jgi:ribose transport system substrate-binding protein